MSTKGRWGFQNEIGNTYFQLANAHHCDVTRQKRGEGNCYWE